VQKLKGLWIPAEILYDKQLSDKEKLILAIIVFLNQEDKGCFASNKYISSIVNVTHGRVSKLISLLREKGYIEVKLKYKNESKEIEERQIIPIVKGTDRYSQDCSEGMVENNYLSCQNQLIPIVENSEDIISIKNIKDNKIKDIPNRYKTDQYHNIDWNKYFDN